MAATNVICDMLMSVRFTKEDPLFQRFTFLIEEGMRLFGEVLMVEYLPAIQYLPGVINAKNKIQRNRQEMFDFYRKVINDHRETLDRENVRDLVDMYLCEIEQAKEEGREGELFEGKDHGKSNDTGNSICLIAYTIDDDDDVRHPPTTTTSHAIICDYSAISARLNATFHGAMCVTCGYERGGGAAMLL